MAIVTLGGTPYHTIGELPAVGATAPAFTLAARDLSDQSLSNYRGKKVVLNIFPSVDTRVCAMSVRTFNQAAGLNPGAVVLCISADLPFAFNRFCAAEGLGHVVMLSTFRDKSFGDAYGVRILDGPFTGLMSRSVVVVDENGTVAYTELVPEIDLEPGYEAALASL